MMNAAMRLGVSPRTTLIWELFLRVPKLAILELGGGFDNVI